MVAAMDISQRICASRRTDREIAAAVGVAVPVVWKWRTGKTTPRVKFIAALAQAIGCAPADLIPPAPAAP